MAVEIPSKFEFEHLLSHTFPGFFSAMSLFILVDNLSSKDITSLVTSDLTNFGLFIGFVLFIGSILGIIIDGIHHSLIEDSFFDHMVGLKEIKDKLGTQCYLEVELKEKIRNSKLLTRHFFYNDRVADITTIHTNLVKNIYCYSEFYSNTFLALILFSMVIPNYLLNTMEFSYLPSIGVSVGSYILAWISLYSGYVAYKRYTQGIYSAIYGLVRKKETEDQNSNNSETVKFSDTTKTGDVTKVLDIARTAENKVSKKITTYTNDGLADWDRKNPLQGAGGNGGRVDIAIYVFVILSSLLIIFSYHPLWQTASEDNTIKLSSNPSSIAVNLTENESYVELIYIENTGINLTSVNISKVEPRNGKWLNADIIQPIPFNQSEIGFLQVNLNASSAGKSVGIYRGFIEIEATNDTDKDLKPKKIKIQILMNVEPAYCKDINFNVNYKSLTASPRQ